MCVFCAPFSSSVFSRTSVRYHIKHSYGVFRKVLSKDFTDMVEIRKSRSIYEGAVGVVRAYLQHTDGQVIYSGSFKISRGVIQGDIIAHPIHPDT